MSETATATFGAGCFWGVEAAFREVGGVLEVLSGYAGGTVDDPTYRQVCSDPTGHAEVVQITYVPSVVSYEQLLDRFWSLHDPTTLNRQGLDIGSQYRSVIFYHTAEQEASARPSKETVNTSGRFRNPVVTAIEPAATFYLAEEYHQKYFEKNGLLRH